MNSRTHSAQDNASTTACMILTLLCKFVMYSAVSINRPSKPIDDSPFGISFFNVRTLRSITIVVALLDPP